MAEHRWVAALLLTLSTWSVAGAQQAPAATTEDFIGLWGSERSFGPLVRGELTIEGGGGQWSAEISGLRTAVRRTEDGQIAFSLPGDEGDFRGQLNGAREIEGFWIQARGATPLVKTYRFATPVTLAMQAKDVWRGLVAPLDDRLSLYLVVRKDAAGATEAFLHNPERNLGIGRLFRVALDGQTLTFVNRENAADRLTGRYDARSGQLSIAVPFLGVATERDFSQVDSEFTFELTRRDRNSAVGFYPRTPAAERYAYRAPVAEDDGWRTGTLAEAGLDLRPIATLVEQIMSTQNTSLTAPQIQALLVARHGKLVLEEYFHGFSKERPHDLRSSGKTIATTMIGVAMQRGYPVSPATRVYPLFPEYQDAGSADPRKQRMTVRDLMTMTAGWFCDDENPGAPGNELNMFAQQGERDWYKYTLGLPMAGDPGGSNAVYCSATINMVGAVVRNTTHTWLPEFFRDNYAKPLDFRRYHLNLMPTGDGYAGGGSYLRPRDLMKLGQLYLSGGTWNGRRILSEAWVREATQQHSTYADDGHGYGYGWHLFERQVGDRKFHGYEATGNGGQLVIVVPELDLVVSFMSGNYENGRTWRQFTQDLTPRYIIAAALKQKGEQR